MGRSVSLALARSLSRNCGWRGREAGSSCSRIKVVLRSAEMARETISSCRPVRWETSGSVWKLSALGKMCGRCVKADGKVGGIASKSIFVNAEANWLDGAPMAWRARRQICMYRQQLSKNKNVIRYGTSCGDAIPIGT